MNTWYKRIVNGKLEIAPTNDLDGKLSGKPVIGFQAWLEENPEEAKRIGFVKVVDHEEDYDHNRFYTIERHEEHDDGSIHIFYDLHEKTEEMILLNELYSIVANGAGFLFVHQ